MPTTPPIKPADDWWSFVRRDEGSALVLQKSDVLGLGTGTALWRVCVVDDFGNSVVQISSARSQESAEADWKWATSTVAASFKRRFPSAEKTASFFIALWNKSHPKIGSVPQIVTAKEQQASDARALQLLMESMERFAADIGTVDDTVCRTCHIVDHFDGFGYPVTATSPSVALHPLPPLSATSPADFSAARSIQQKKLRLALNSYRFVTRQPQSLPGQRQRAAKNQLIAQREASSAEGVPPQPQRLPPRPLSQSERQSEQQQQQQHQQPQRPRTQVIK